ncbi:hypothetical protein [Novosphingobium mangrovi (ex Hu et al. 2023)]|uniref:Uncharacterized protein n=1 Tax=Novosphingobium mangrovi (ex Hu et al. 2023) TaxID=2930094 RepID=A0ABT0A7S5_9SPHN|nr:hypothetical protein [Novosphingobium mangrovi (ex Hu et al. 2023)]MCJ1959227.1 hypothetical protein [Novosphingobium mangrovi (ex Hu et al. 2023)]
MRTRPGICQRKKRFASEEEALRVAEKAPFPLRPYRCELCGDVHLTGRTKGMKLPAFEIARRRAAKAVRREDAAR